MESINYKTRVSDAVVSIQAVVGARSLRAFDYHWYAEDLTKRIYRHADARHMQVLERLTLSDIEGLVWQYGQLRHLGSDYALSILLTAIDYAIDGNGLYKFDYSWNVYRQNPVVIDALVKNVFGRYVTA